MASPTSAADDRRRRVEPGRAQQPEAVVDDGRDRAGHVPCPDQRADGEQDEQGAHPGRHAPDRRVADPGDAVAVLEGDQAGDDGARQQRDLQRPARRVGPEQGDRQPDQHDQRDDRDERVEQGRLAWRRRRVWRLVGAGVVSHRRAPPRCPDRSPPYQAAMCTITAAGDASGLPRSAPPRANATSATIAEHGEDPDDPAGRAVHDCPPSDRVAHDRAGHAVPAAAALAELEALDRDDLDARLAHLRDRERVALVGDDDAGLERDDVVAVVPLLALLLVGVAAGLDDVELRDAQRVARRPTGSPCPRGRRASPASSPAGG